MSARRGSGRRWLTSASSAAPEKSACDEGVVSGSSKYELNEVSDDRVIPEWLPVATACLALTAAALMLIDGWWAVATLGIASVLIFWSLLLSSEAE